MGRFLHGVHIGRRRWGRVRRLVSIDVARLGRQGDGVLVEPGGEDDVGIATGGHAGTSSDRSTGPDSVNAERRIRVA